MAGSFARPRVGHGPVWPSAFLLACVLGLAPSESLRADESSTFVAGVEDLPLMPGLVEIGDAGVVFDKPGGRIVEAYAEGKTRRAEVIAFYGQTLPQLGWRAAGATIYRREGERLEFDFLGADGDLV